MPQIVLPYSASLRLPTSLSSKRPVKFGTELEGFYDPQTFQEQTQKDNLFGCADDFPWEPAYGWERLDDYNPFVPEIEIAGHNQLAYFLNTLDCSKRSAPWTVVQDGTIEAPLHQYNYVAAEVVTPTLSGNHGLIRVKRNYDVLKKYGFFTNETCGLHVHVSLGWNKEKLVVQTREELTNIRTAIDSNEHFLDRLVSPWRLKHEKCRKLDRIFSYSTDPRHNETKRFLSDINGCDGKDVAYNFLAFSKHGTIEYRLKEADDYTQSIGYIGFIVAFTFEAAQNPNIRAEHVLKKYFPDRRPYELRTTTPRADLTP